MERWTTDILRIVREEIAVYRDLVEHARHKTALLVRGRVDAILESNKVEETFSVILRILENEMSRLCSDLCEALKIPREEFTLLKLADDAEQSIAEEIKYQTNLFKNLIEQLKSVNERNMRVVENPLHYSKALLDFLSNVTASYQETGLFKPAPAAQTTFSDQA
jgi:hypothetical protein